MVAEPYGLLAYYYITYMLLRLTLTLYPLLLAPAVSEEAKTNSTVIIVVAVCCSAVVIVAAIVAVVMTRKRGQPKHSTGAHTLEFSNPSFGSDPESSMLSFDEPLDLSSEA